MTQPQVSTAASGKRKRGSSRMLDITGRVRGDISGQAIIIHPGAVVTGNLGARKITIHGWVKGLIEADAVAIGKTARISGELRYAKLSVDHGAKVEARLVPSDPRLQARRRSA
jgi:cytoskeletal protein CcmA (bactofilin family)